MLNSVSHLMESGTGFCLPERRQKKGWSLTFGRTATAVFASLAIAGTPAMAAYAAAQQGSGPAGNDVSYPQCGKTLGEQRFLLSCSAAEGKGQAIVTR